jgi:hypothetical protein
VYGAERSQRREDAVDVLRSRSWLLVGVVGAVLLLVALLVLDGAAGAIVLAFGLLAIFGAAVRVISRGDSRQPDERRVPAGHSGV